MNIALNYVKSTLLANIYGFVIQNLTQHVQWTSMIL